ncbi:hypothetical protein DL96DRAFT_495852 [Flagelloscypha sp. PMI_526]|nr:hypothetical protein DL96DRAFT_495852 [Flagelloscypha sp. PMI_526]
MNFYTLPWKFCGIQASHRLFGTWLLGTSQGYHLYSLLYSATLPNEFTTHSPRNATSANTPVRLLTIPDSNYLSNLSWLHPFSYTILRVQFDWSPTRRHSCLPTACHPKIRPPYHRITGSDEVGLCENIRRTMFASTKMVCMRVIVLVTTDNCAQICKLCSFVVR